MCTNWFNKYSSDISFYWLTFGRVKQMMLHFLFILFWLFYFTCWYCIFLSNWLTTEKYFSMRTKLKVFFHLIVGGLNWRYDIHWVFCEGGMSHCLSKSYINSLSANPIKWSHSNNLSVVCRQIVWVCLTILWGWH